MPRKCAQTRLYGNIFVIVAHKTVVQGLVRTIKGRRITPSQAIADHIDDPTDHPNIIYMAQTTRPNKIEKWEDKARCG
jgi:hypothetical protein